MEISDLAKRKVGCRRSKLEVKICILRLLKEHRKPLHATGNSQGMKLTWIYGSARITFVDCKEILSIFKMKELVREFPDRTYGITEKGREILSQFEIVQKHLIE